MFVNRFIDSEEGYLSSFVAIFLPIALLIGALVLESGNFYIRHEELRSLAKQSANSGLIEFSQILLQRATDNKNILCSVEIPPSKCSSTNSFNFLTAEEIQNLALDFSVQNQVQMNARDFSREYDPLKLLQNENITVDFPFDYVTQDEVKLKVIFSQKLDTLFSNIGTGEKTISVEAISFLSLP